MVRDDENCCEKCGRPLENYNNIEVIEVWLIMNYTCPHCWTRQNKVYSIFYEYTQI